MENEWTKKIEALQAENAALRRDLEEARGKLKPVTVMCGSSRYTDIMAVCAWLIERDEHRMTMGLHLLPAWYSKEPIPDHLAESENCAAEMDALHIAKIDAGDEIFVVNYQDYIGESTQREIEYAMSHNKRIRWFTHDPVGEKVSEIMNKRIYD